MPNSEDIEQQQRLLETYRRTLADWRNQQAQFGIHTPPHVLHGIREARDEIRRIKATLDGWGVDVEDHPDDEPATDDQPPTTDHRPLTTDEPRTGAGPPTPVGHDLVGRDQIGAQQSQGFINQASGPISQTFIQSDVPAPPVIPACPQPNAEQLFGRAEFISGLTMRLTSGSGTVAISAVRGLPGVGKSDLLRAAGNDARIKAHFTGGVLYAELGPSPDLSQWLRRWIAALGHEPPRSDDAETLAGALRAALAQRRTLLIVDDVWEASLRPAKALRDCGSPECRVMASSRSRQVAQEVAKGAPPLELDVLAEVPALELLRHSAHDGGVDIVARDEGGAAALVAALGGLPLALKLAGGWLRANHRQPRYRAHPCAGLLKVWREKLDELRGYEQRPAPLPTTTPAPPLSPQPGSAPAPPLSPQRERGLGGEGLSLDAIIGLSYAALPDDATRAAAAALAAFGATPLDWDWDAMAAVWGAIDPTQKRPGRIRRWLAQVRRQNLNRPANPDVAGKWESTILASGLLDYDAETERYSLHQTVEAFLARRADPAVYERHVAYFAALMNQHGEETLLRLKGDIDAALATLDREIGQIERGQQRAAEAEPTPSWDARLIDYAFACATYFDLRGRYDQQITWSEAGRQAAQRRERERDTATLLNNIAIAYDNTGHYKEAITAYDEAINVYRSLNGESDLAMALGNLGSVYQSQGRYDEAITHFQQSLEISRRIGDLAGTAVSLSNFGVVYGKQGHHDKAITHFQQSLEISRRIGDLTGIADTLGNLGGVYHNQGRYDEAITHYQQSLEISRRIGAVATTVMMSWNLGTLYEKQGGLAAALPLIEEAAQIAERIGMPQAQKYRAKVEELRGRMGGEDGTAEPLMK